jgi:hypothetical protein
MDESLYGSAPVRSFAREAGKPMPSSSTTSAKKKALGHYAVFATSNSGKTT